MRSGDGGAGGGTRGFAYCLLFIIFFFPLTSLLSLSSSSFRSHVRPTKPNCQNFIDGWFLHCPSSSNALHHILLLPPIYGGHIDSEPSLVRTNSPSLPTTGLDSKMLNILTRNSHRYPSIHISKLQTALNVLDALQMIPAYLDII